MKGLLQLMILVALAWAGYQAVTQPERIGLSPLPTIETPTSDPEKPTEIPPRPELSSAQVTDAAIQTAVAQQPISIQFLRRGKYPGSPLTVEEQLPAGSNYSRQVVSYQSENLKIYALLTVPNGTPPAGGWPAIVFNHGYIPPRQYRTTERYVAYQDAFASNGFVTLKSDYRGHGKSEGEAKGGYNDAGYTVDVLNAAASLKQDKRVNRQRLGIWGHSMGGQLSLRAMLVDPEIRAASLWAGVVASYDILATDWHSPSTTFQLDTLNRRYLRLLSPNAYLSDLRGRPIQLHHGSADQDVPYRFQQDLASDLREAKQRFVAYRYEGDDHNLSQNVQLALSRSVQFFQNELKAPAPQSAAP